MTPVDEITTRMRWVVSTMYRSPAGLSAIPCGVLSVAAVAGPLSPVLDATPQVPA
jgi:hypothetical protein